MQSKNISLGTETIQKIIAYIKDNQLTSGDKLPKEAALMSTLDVGRSTIREAMQVLAHSGVVTIKQGSGTYVNQLELIDDQNPLLWRTEKMLEKEAIAELVDNDIAPDEWITLRAYLTRRNQLLEQGKFNEYLEQDILFHEQIVKMAQNAYLIKWFNELKPLWRSHLNQSIAKSPNYQGKVNHHNQLFEALMNRDVKTAIELIQKVGK
ncbi:FadR/GntR family transcriptional regulator [Lactobacillus sp. Sy-1]|uniref:FadR/GntR family transcriptional regulator n=1 Tax=Lactobacillus sp. Sy-1 TaxID=2109645 RepID=UPI001C5BF733|nr:GntR family transcriptional regulator [Lactobacillus sp. Sy-1]MBW1606348.1 FadR family transcriptional regulator [Lactobacillus sp. Sy-1]